MKKVKFIFNPYKDQRLNEEVRLVIYDWKAEKVHSVNNITPMQEFTVNEDELDTHLYYKYKYQVNKDGKWEDYTSYKNLPERETEEGIKYLYYHYPNSRGLIVVFQALAGIPGYNYIRTLKDIPISKLYIKDEYGPEPTRASYYLGENKHFDIAEHTAKLIEKVRQYNMVPRDSVICAGSSKGGFASIYQAYLNGYGYVISGGPQIYLGDYLGKSLGNPKSVLAPIYTFLTGSTEEDKKEWANEILTKLVKNKSQEYSPHLYIHVGKGEPHYKNHVLPFYQFLQGLENQRVELDLGDYAKHDELAKYFPTFLKHKVENILKVMPYDQLKIFKRTEPNKSSVEIAEKIMDNEIFLFKTWEPYKFEGELKWDEDPYNDRTWKFYLHELRVVSFLVNAYELTNDMQYLRKARWFIESWLSKNPSPTNNVSEWAWSGHGTANRLLNLLYFWFFYKDTNEYDNVFKAKFELLLLEHGRFLENDDNYEDYNHGIFQDQALLELSVLFPKFEQSKYWTMKAVNRLTDRINKDFSQSGVHKEHSPGYHLLVMKLYLSLKNFMDFYSIRFSGEIKNKFIQMQDYLAVLVNKDGYLPILGDTGLSKVLRSLKEDEIVSDYWLYMSSKGLKGKPLESSFYPFLDGGIAVYKGDNTKQNNIEWLFTSAFHSTVHKHADDLSFLLTINKTNYFVDSGRYNYKEKDSFRRFFRSVFAHNTIAVDGKTYPLIRSQVGKSRILNYKETDKYIFVRGTHQLYEDINVTRTIFQLKEGSIFIHDKMHAAEKHRYTQIFNIGKDVTINKKSKEVILLKSKIDKSLIEFKQLKPIKEVNVFEGSKDPIRGWQSFDFNEKHPIKSIDFTIEGSTEEFITVLNIGGAKNIIDVKVTPEQDETLYEVLDNRKTVQKILVSNDLSINPLVNNENKQNEKRAARQPMITDIILSIDNDLVPQGTTITFSTEASGEGLTYAWYIYHNNERIAVKRYSDINSLTINLDQEGSYYLKAFVMDKSGNKFSRNTKKIDVYKEDKIKKSILNEYNHIELTYDELDKVEINLQTPTILAINKKNVKYEYLVKTNKESPFLYVIGSGAYNAKEFDPPVFQRHSWLEDLKANVIFYNDPTLYLGDINLGWGQGTEEEYYLKNIASMVKSLAAKMNIKNNKILFYGSSAGGFMSLMLSGFFKESSVFVNNPQTIVPNYFKSHVRELYKVSYPNLTEQEIVTKFNNRLDTRAFYKSIGFVPNIYYLQNAACQHDMENHFIPFFEDIRQLLKEERSGQLITQLYWDEESQHNPVSKEETLKYIDRAVEMFSIKN